MSGISLCNSWCSLLDECSPSQSITGRTMANTWNLGRLHRFKKLTTSILTESSSRPGRIKSSLIRYTQVFGFSFSTRPLILDNKHREIDVHNCVYSWKVTSRKHFDEQLLDHIRKKRNAEAETMLNEELAKMFDYSDDHGTLLHHTIASDNVVIAQKLIELRADVNWFGRGRCPTPLTLAVIRENAAAVEILLKAGARGDLPDDRGLSPLLLVLQCTNVDNEIFKLLVSKLRTIASTNEELADILIRAGCTMYHATALRDIKVMECMLRRGVDIDSKGFMGKTALHGAGELDDVSLTDWLLKNGANVDALDDNGTSTLYKSAMYGSKAMVQFLLEHGASPDGKSNEKSHTPFVAAFQRLLVPGWGAGLPERVELLEPVELLLQYGASLPSSVQLTTWFQGLLIFRYDKTMKLLMAHMTMLEKLGKLVDKSVAHAMHDSFLEKVDELWEYYESCQKVLAIKVFENVSLLDLLNESDDKLRLLVRKETFLQDVKRISSEHKLNELYSDYYNTLMKRIGRASRVGK